jgi:hypothetical protein
MSRAYKNKKYNKDNYIKFGVSPKYFGLQAKRFPGSVKKAYCDIDRDEEAEVTFTKRRSPAVRKNYECLTIGDFAPAFGPQDLSQAVPELGPADLESVEFPVPVSGPSNLSVVAPAVGPQNLSSSLLASSSGPQNLTSSIIIPAAGPQSLEVSSNPTSGPQDLATSIVNPTSGPGSLISDVVLPSQGPSELISTAAIPISGPQNLDGTVEPMLTPELIGSVVLEVQGLFQGILLDGYYRQVEGLKGYFNPEGDWLTDTVFDGFVYERVIDEDCVPTVYTLWLYKARYPNTRGELLEAWEFGNVQPAQGSRSTRKQVNTGPASTTGVHAQYSNNHESPFRVAGDLSYIFSRFYRRDGAPCE